MASGFLNSAGTDLDNLFSDTSSNAGALGFKVSNGQDLGNRYIAGSIGTNVGYKNNAGTDIGFLRGKIVAPTATISLSRSNHIDRDASICLRTDSYGEVCEASSRDFSYTATTTVNISNDQPVTNVQYIYQIKCPTDTGRDCANIYLDSLSGTLIYKSTSSAATNKWITFYTSNSVSLTESRHFRFRFTCFGYEINGNGQYDVRVQVVVTNSAGSNTYTSSNTLYNNEDY